MFVGIVKRRRLNGDGIGESQRGVNREPIVNQRVGIVKVRRLRTQMNRQAFVRWGSGIVRRCGGIVRWKAVRVIRILMTAYDSAMNTMKRMITSWKNLKELGFDV